MCVGRGRVYLKDVRICDCGFQLKLNIVYGVRYLRRIQNNVHDWQLNATRQELFQKACDDVT
jgi:hypothetical protein